METIVNRMTCARLPTADGTFALCLYRTNLDQKEHLALVFGEPEGQAEVLVRVHSECFTGDVLGSMRCDCGPQLNQAMGMIAAAGQGVIIYLRQEGRGIGLLDKLRAYNLQDEGYDTVDANILLGHPVDDRDYTIAALILEDLGLRSLRLMTNNPAKVEGLQSLGITISERVPLHTGVNQENVSYLATKVNRMRHLLNLEPSPLVPAQAVPGNGNGSGRGDQRPLVTLTYAQSLDGSITHRRGQPLALSGAESLIFTHNLRASHDAILVGIGTVLADDPSLTVRLVNGDNPQPIILDSQLRMPLASKLLAHPDRAPWIVTSSPDVQRRHALEQAGARVICVEPAVSPGSGSLDLVQVLARLHAESVCRLMVEGGAQVITSFLSQRVVDRLIITIAPVMVGGVRAVGHAPQPFPRLQHMQHQQLGDDVVIMGDVVWG